jgi:hypothetical protein
MSGISKQQFVTFYLQDRHLKDPVRLLRDGATTRRCPISDIHLQSYALFERHSVILSAEDLAALPANIKDEGWFDFFRANALFIAEGEFPKFFPFADKQGKKRNIPEAIAILTSLSDRLNFPPAQNSLALCYYWGIGVKQDNQSMVIWMKKAADQNFAIAIRNMGWCYREGIGLSQNYEMAFEWYQKALNLGLTMAAFDIGSLYENAEKPNLQEALKYYQYAAGKGIQKASAKIEELRQKLPAVKPRVTQPAAQSAINLQDFFNLLPRIQGLEEQVQQLRQQLAQKDQQIGELLKQQETHNVEMKAMLTLVLQKLDYESVAKNPDPLDQSNIK